MAQSNHSVKIDVTANAEEAKKDLREIEALLNKLSKGANLGLGGGGRRGGGSGGGAGGSGGGAGGGGGADPTLVPGPMYLFRMKQTMRERSQVEKEESKRRTEGQKAADRAAEGVRKQHLSMQQQLQKEENDQIAAYYAEQDRMEQARQERQRQMASDMASAYEEREKGQKAALKRREALDKLDAKAQDAADKAQKKRYREQVAAHEKAAIRFRKSKIKEVARAYREEEKARDRALKQENDQIAAHYAEQDRMEQERERVRREEEHAYAQHAKERQKALEAPNKERQRALEKEVRDEQRSREKAAGLFQKVQEKAAREKQRAQEKAAREEQKAQEKAAREKQRAQEKAAAEEKRSTVRFRKSKAKEFERAYKEERKRLDDLEREDIGARQASERRRYAFFTGTARLGGRLGVAASRGAFDPSITGASVMQAAGNLVGGLGPLGQAFSPVLRFGAAGLNLRQQRAQQAAQLEPLQEAIRMLSGADSSAFMTSAATGLGVGPQASLGRLRQFAVGTGRRVSDPSEFAYQSLAEQVLGIDPNSLRSFMRAGTLSRSGANRERQVRRSLAGIESFRQQQGLLPAELTMLRQAGLGFRQQGLAQGFDIQESSLFGLTKGIMGGATSGAGKSLTGAMGLAQRERQLGVGAFQSFAGQFADLPNTLLLAQAAQGGGGVGDILSRLSRLGGRPGASAAALSRAGGRFGIPREILQAGISAQLGLGFEAGGDVLGARARALRGGDIGPMEPFRRENLALSRAFAGEQLRQVEVAAGPESAAILEQILQANASLEQTILGFKPEQMAALMESLVGLVEDIRDRAADSQTLDAILDIVRRTVNLGG